MKQEPKAQAGSVQTKLKQVTAKSWVTKTQALRAEQYFEQEKQARNQISGTGTKTQLRPNRSGTDKKLNWSRRSERKCQKMSDLAPPKPTAQLRFKRTISSLKLNKITINSRRSPFTLPHLIIKI
jgi:hypothetical protein